MKIKERRINHPAHAWAKQRNVKPGTRYPATCQIFDKPNGPKGTVAYDNGALLRLKLINGNNQTAFKAVTRIGGFLFNTRRKKQLIGKLKGVLWWMNNYVPYPLPKGNKAIAENILCDGNPVEIVERRQGWVKIAAGTGQLTEIASGTNYLFWGTLRWKHKSGWVPKDLVVS